jgi:hypothetical protein
MYRAMVRRALKSGLVVALVILTLIACGAGGQEQANKPRPLPEGSYPIALHPGEYRSEEFKPSFSFTVGKGWKTTGLRLQTSWPSLEGERNAPC